jgi:hypothetical protein
MFSFNNEKAKFSTNSICLNKHSPKSYNKLKCESQSSVIFITLVQYSNDHLNECSLNDKTTLKKKNESLSSTKKCFAYPTQSLAEFCNGKNECLIKLDRPEFKFGTMGANCNFISQILTINYECIPVRFNDDNLMSIPKFDICAHSKIINPQYGFIHSPNYPDTYPATQYCQLTLSLNEQIERVEIFLIDMETEALSLKSYEPTDYLEIDQKEKFFGKKYHLFIYNSTQDVLLKFRTDLLFNKRGFLLYFQAIRKVEEIDLEEEHVDTTTTTTTTALSTTTTTVLNLTRNSTAAFLRAAMTDVRQDEISRSENSSSNTNSTILLLGGLVVLLSSIVVLLLFVNRRRIFGQNSQSYFGNKSDNGFISRPINPLMNDTSVFNAAPHHLSTTNLSATTAGIIPLNATQLVPLKLNKMCSSSQNGQRISDDSMTHLLLLNTSSSYIEPYFISSKRSSSNETVVVNMKELDEKNIRKLNSIESGNPLHNHVPVKPNEYCYIHANGLIIGNIQTAAQEPINVSISEENKTPQQALKSENISPGSLISNSSTSGSNMSPNMSFETNYNLNNVTSTPSLPKTMPPSIHHSQKIDLDETPKNESEKTDSDNEYDNNLKSLQTVIQERNSINIEEDEYQVPINLPK